MSDLVSPFNPAKLLWHRSRIEAARTGQATLAPVSLEWDTSNICPHDCPFCSFGTSESQGYRQQNWQHFDFDRALRLIPELEAAGLESITFTGGGEPLIHPRIADILSRVSDGPIQWGLVTNGYLLRGLARRMAAEYARFVRVSLDAGTTATHNLVHRPKTAQFETILGNMRDLVAEGRKATEAGVRTVPLTVGASFCVMDANCHELHTLVERLQGIGVDYLEVRPTYPTDWRGDGWDGGLRDVGGARLALNEARRAVVAPFRVIGMVDRFDALEQPAKGYSRCQIGPLTSVLGADGRLWHCCVQRGQDAFALGNVYEGTWAETWAAAQAKRLVDTINVDKCPRCRYDNYNRLLAGLESDQLHVDFV